MNKQIVCPVCELNGNITVMTDKKNGKSFCPKGHGFFTKDQIKERREELKLDEVLV